ncbi:MAG: family 16 glycosylhydrolase [Puniceicoccaceae bacterium]
MTCLALHADTELNIPGYRIVWNDEFEGATVDTSKWDVNVGVNAWYQRASDGQFVEPHWFNDEFEPWLQAGTINDERQYYTPDNVSVSDGILEIKADYETVTDPVGLYTPGYHEYTSGKLNTADEFQFTFGILKWRAQLPAGQGMWPALWMLNAPDPWYWDDEIDIMEGWGSRPTQTSSAHHFKVGPNNSNQYNSDTLDTGVNLQTSFHEYGLEWTSTSITTWWDDQVVFTDAQAIPQGPMFLIMNAAVGGLFDGVPADNGIFPSYFLIDWVRVWQPASTTSDLASGGFEEYQGPQWANWNTQDDGNLASVTTGALHGAASVQINPLNSPDTGGEPAPNLLTDGSAGSWSGWLNQQDEGGEITAFGSIDPSTIPATTSDDSVTISIYQTSPPPRANAVVFRQLDGAVVQGLSLTYTGTVAIEETFAAGNEASAFIRIFNPDYSFTDVATSVVAGGDFTLQADIPASGVPFIQVGLETTGPTGSAGRLAATSLFLKDDAIAPPSDPDNRTGFVQTVTATAGQDLRYGLLAANHGSDPIGTGALGRLRIEFLDSGESVLSESMTTIVDNATPATATPWILEATTPANTAFVRLSIERVTTDADTDLSGSFIADAAFLHLTGTTELPVFTSEPPSQVVVKDGQTVDLEITVTSSSSLAYQWYHSGAPVSTMEDYSFTATPGSAGNYFAVANNGAGPMIGALTELVVLDAGPDSDGDFISDSDETNVYGTNPLKADSDGDGLDDYDELFGSRTDPLDPSSAFRITDFQMSSDQVEITFDSVIGLSYSILASPDLAEWDPIGSSHTATGASTTIIETIPVNVPAYRFFRISVNP